jgi:DNA-binding response OmpR family regulator
MGKIILLIDDDIELGRLAEEILRPIEATIYQAFSGEEGLRRAYEIHPDLIILDIMMPGMDGFDVCARLRELSSVPVLMLTARTNKADILRSFNVGVDDFVKKPFNKDELEARVRALLRRSNNHNHKAEAPSYITSYKDDVLEVDLAKQTVKLYGKIVELTQENMICWTA